MIIRIERDEYDDNLIHIVVSDIIKGVRCHHTHSLEVDDSFFGKQDIIKLINNGIFEAQKALEESIKRKLSEF